MQAEERYQELRAAFVSDHGEITDSYICESGPMAVALATVRPTPLERKLLRTKDRIDMYTETERLVRMHPEVAQILHRAEVQYVSVRNALRGLSQRLLVNWLFVWMRDLMLAAIPEPDGTVVPLPEKWIAEQNRELDRIEQHYEQAASREAQIVYLGGMLAGVLALCAVTVPAGLLLAASDTPVNLTTFFGGVFGLLVYFTLQGGVIRQLDVPADDRDRFAFFLVLAFAAGFSERLVKEVLRSANGREEPTATRKRDGAAPAPAPPDA